MKIRLLISMVGPEIDLAYGDIIDTNEKHGLALIAAGQGELVKDEKSKTERATKSETIEKR